MKECTILYYTRNADFRNLKKMIFRLEAWKKDVTTNENSGGTVQRKLNVDLE